MKTTTALILALTTLTSLNSMAISADSEEFRRSFGIKDFGNEIEGAFQNAKALQEFRDQALNALNLRTAQLKAAVTAELQRQPFEVRTADCMTFATKTRYEAAPFHQRLRELTSDGKLSEYQKSILTDAQKAKIQGWIDYARNVNRAEFTGSFSPDSCTQRTVGMTDEKAARNVKGLELLVRNLERIQAGAL